jgi:hypothetical protein
MIVRLVTLTAMILTGWGQAASLGAVEAIRLPMSCNYIGNKVMLVPTPNDQLHVIVGDRDHKTVLICAPGAAGKCRNWEVHRFDFLCGGKQVSWRLVAGQLLTLISLERRDAPFRARVEPWELRTVFSDPEFAPVDEFGGRILLLADKSVPQPPAGRNGASAKAVMAAEIASQPPGSSKLEPDTASPKIEPPKTAATVLLSQAEASPPHASGTATGQTESTNIATPSAKADPLPADAATMPQVDGSKREVNPAFDADAATAEATASDAPPPDLSAHAQNGFAGLLLIVSISVLVVIIIFLMIFSATMRWKPAWPRLRTPHSGIVRKTYESGADQAEPDAEASAEACRELMKEVTAELVKAMSVVNSLRRVPALQAALHAELESIRRSLGFTPQIRGTPGEKKDWKHIRSQLVLSLHGAQRIIGIAEAARTSFSVHPAALEVITTRLEAYAFLGVNANSSESVLKKAVNALRECWHPDLATNEEDRRLREIRIKQINVAWDLITGKQMSY